MLIKLTPFTNVLAGQTATIDLLALTAGRVIDRVILALGGTTFTKSMLTDIRIKANAKIIWQDNGARTDGRNQYRGLVAHANYLTIDLDEIRAKDMLDQKLGSIDTTRSGIRSLTMEVDIAGSAVAPTLAAWCECSWQSTQVEATQGSQYAGADLIGKVLNFPHQVNASAAKYPITIPYGRQGGSLIKRIHLVPPASGITLNGFEVRKNGVTIFDGSIAVNNFINTEYQRLTQAGWIHCDFINDGNLYGNILNAAEAQTMEYYADVTVTAPGTVQVIVEMLDLMANN